MQFSIISAGLLLLAPLASAASAPEPTQQPKESPKLGYPTSQGCFKSSKGLTEADLDETKVSSGGCREVCQDLKKPVFALSTGTTCLCGDSYPPKADLTDDSACNYPCQAYPLEACGNLNGTAFSVWNIGDKVSVPFYGDDDASSSSGSKTATSSGSKTAVSTSIITGAVESATGVATAASAETETASSTNSAAVATSSIPSSGAKSLMGAGVAIFVAALAI